MNDFKENILKAIRQSELRSRRTHTYDAAEYIEHHGLLLGWLSKLVRTIERFVSPLNLAYFPSSNDEVIAIWRDRYSNHFSVIDNNQFHLENVMKEFSDYLVSENEVGFRVPIEKGSEILLLIKPLEAYLRIEDGTEIISYRIQELRMIPSSDPLNKQLTGILMINTHSLELSNEQIGVIYNQLIEDYVNYIQQVHGYYQLDRDYLVTRIINTDEKRNESSSNGMIYGTRLLHHRFSHLRQAAENIAQTFSNPEKVTRRPERYVQAIQNLRVQMDAARRLSHVLEVLGEDPQINPCDVQEAFDIYQNVFEKELESFGGKGLISNSYQIRDQKVLKAYIIPPYRLLDEVFRIHIDNCIREALKEITQKREIELEIRDSRDFVYMDIKNYGPPIPPDIYEDIRKFKQVRNAQGSGLGVFLSTQIMNLVQGTVNWYSPIENGMGTKVILGFRKYS